MPRSEGRRQTDREAETEEGGGQEREEGSGRPAWWLGPEAGAGAAPHR